MQRNLHSNPVYFDRVKGIFRVCFPFAERPKQSSQSPGAGGGNDDPKLRFYLNPVDEWCTNINYYLDSFETGIVPIFLVLALICLFRAKVLAVPTMFFSRFKT